MEPTPQEIQQIFSALDIDHSGSVDAKELQAALQSSGFALSLSSIAMLIRVHDPNGDGKMNIQEFGRLHMFLAQAQHAFASAAGSPEARHITVPQLRNALNTLGYNWIEGPAFNAMFLAFDPERDSMVGLTEFFAMSAYLRTVVGVFKGFDPQGRGVVSMTMNQFLYAASNTR